jgi:cephalosporin hydroxylase
MRTVSLRDLPKLALDDRERLREDIARKVLGSEGYERRIGRRFHRMYYGASSRTWKDTAWFGVGVKKCPLDLWIYQEILHEVRPDVIVETGTRFGGSAFFLASICDLLGTGRVVTVDIEHSDDRPSHDRITYLTGSSTAPDTVERVKSQIGEGDDVLVIFDSDHSRDHVLAEMRLYAPVVTKGSYLIVEDSNVNGNPVRPSFGPGPMEAIDTFLSDRDDFVVDDAREKFFMTFNPRGYLKRVA